MDGWLYPVSLVVVAVMAFMFFQNHNSKLALLMLALGIYIVYSHETGYTATDFKNETVKSLDESASEWAKEHGNEGYNEVNAQEAVK